MAGGGWVTQEKEIREKEKEIKGKKEKGERGKRLAVTGLATVVASEWPG